MMVSVLLLTFNEESNLPRCLEALAWCDDIVAIDSGSADRSVEILRTYGARVLHRPFDTFAGQRNFGLENGGFKHDWILHLDADEVVTIEFVRALENLNCQDGIDGYFVPSKTMLFNRWLKYAGMWPSYQARLGHRDRMRFKQVGHGQRETLQSERMGFFSEAYLHYNFSHGIEHWLEKHIRYARDEAALISQASEVNTQIDGKVDRRRLLKRMANRLPLFMRPLVRFLYVFLWRQGFRDGSPGLVYAVMLSVYEGMIAIFVYEKYLSSRSSGKE